MSKNKRKRRLKEEDFKKKKLKVGKKLPMPDNVTRTSFKARSIHIAQQVRKIMTKKALEKTNVITWPGILQLLGIKT